MFNHTIPIPNKTPKHSVFSDSRDKIIDLVDEAFSKAKQHPVDKLRYEVDLGRVIGIDGETKMRIVVDPNTKKISTAHPILDADTTVPGI